MSKTLEESIAYFHAQLRKSKFAINYIKSRGISRDSAIKFQLGYCPSGDGDHAQFQNRLIFPIHNAQGEPVGWTGRTLGDDPAKYVNSKDSVKFKKSSLLYLFHIAAPAIYKTKTIIICEGQVDAVMLHQYGFNNAVATSGTTSFKEEAAMLSARYAMRAFILFDGDTAGIKSSMGVVKHLEDVGISDITNAVLPDAMDPASFLLQYGRNPLVEVLRNARQNR